MQNLLLYRFRTSEQGTQGIIITNTGFSCRTLELPWKNNQRNISRIPNGEYILKMVTSPKFGKVYWVTNVPERSGILIHSGNYAGDISKGYKSHSSGCIIIGQKHGILGNQLAVLNSRITLKRFQRHMNCETFKLKIFGG